MEAVTRIRLSDTVQAFRFGKTPHITRETGRITSQRALASSRKQTEIDMREFGKKERHVDME